MAHKPTPFQTAIYEAVAQLSREWPDFVSPNMGVDAVAGSGKSTTILEAAKLIPLLATGAYMAFNTKIVNEIKAKGMPSNVQVMTLNSYGWRVCGRNIRGIKLDADKTRLIAGQIIDDRKHFFKCLSFIKRMVGLCKAHYVVDLSYEWACELAEKFAIDWPEEVQPAVVYTYLHRVYMTCIHETGLMDFDDQLFMPIYNNWALPQFDFLFIDECQDLNHVQSLLVRGATKQGRVIAVGDPYQAIYGFRGADPDAFPNLMEDLKAKLMPLSVCFRCPKKVIAKAQTIVPQIMPWENAKEGVVNNITKEDYRKMVKDGDFVLCRTTAPLVAECLYMIRNKRKAMVEGRDLGRNLMESVEQIDRMAGTNLVQKVQTYRVVQTQKYEKMEQEGRIIEVNDRCDTILAIIEACLDVPGRVLSTGQAFVDGPTPHIDTTQREITKVDVIAKINEIFSDVLVGIVYCTAHRSKGLERPRVFQLRPDLMPHPAAKKPWQKKQEMNLLYVLWTRAQEELYIVAGE